MAWERIDDHLSFNRELHQFKIDGTPVPSVTQILKGAGIIDDRWFSEYSATRGTLIHQTCELYDLGDLDEETLDPVLAGYLAGWKKFRDETEFVQTQIESPVYNIGLQYAGILDRVGYVNDENTLIDIKSGAVPWWVGLQLAAYASCLYPPFTGDRLAVQLSQDGTWKPHYFNNRQDWKDFQACLHVEHLKRRNRL